MNVLSFLPAYILVRHFKVQKLCLLRRYITIRGDNKIGTSLKFKAKVLVFVVC